MITKERKYTIEDYKNLPEGSRYQLIEGKLIMTPKPNPLHQIILANIFSLLKEWIASKDLGIVLPAPVDIYFDEDNGYQPDIVFISKNNFKFLRDDGFYGAPDIIVEILSPSTAYYDLKEKFYVYEKQDVKEYWIVDPLRKEVELYKNKDKNFMLVQKIRRTGKMSSLVLENLVLDAKDIFNTYGLGEK